MILEVIVVVLEVVLVVLEVFPGTFQGPYGAYPDSDVLSWSF